MNKKTGLINLLVLFSAVFVFPVEAIEIPGGIVAANAKKEIVYYDFKTGQTANLTPEVPEAATHPFAISEDGKILIIVKGQEFLVKRLGSKNLEPARDSAHLEKKLKAPQNVEGLALSRNGGNFSCEYKALEPAWVQVPRNSQVGRALLQKGFEPNAVIPDFVGQCPILLKQPDVFSAVNFFDLNFANVAGRRGICGNTAIYPTVFPFITTNESLNDLPAMNPLSKLHICSGLKMVFPNYNNLGLSHQYMRQRFSDRRNAHYCAWWVSKEEAFCAVIYHTSNGWGPIEIRDANYRGVVQHTLNGRLSALKARGLKPGIYEIPIILENCQWLAFTPAGSLTYSSRGKISLLGGERIRQGIENSGIAQNPNFREDFRPIPVKNIFAIEPVLLADEIKTSRFFWTSERSFIFRNEDDNGLYAWSQGDIKRLLKRVPEKFFYCNPISAPVFYAESQKNGAPSALNFLSGNDRTMQKVYGFNQFSIGSISFLTWTQNDAESVKLELTMPNYFLIEDGTDISNITDPRQYKCTRNFSYEDGPNVKVRLGQTIILKHANAYAALKPISLEKEKLPKAVQERYKRYRKEPPATYKWMTYEWKFWPNVPTKLASVSKEAVK